MLGHLLLLSFSLVLGLFELRFVSIFNIYQLSHHLIAVIQSYLKTLLFRLQMDDRSAILTELVHGNHTLLHHLLKEQNI